MSMYHDGDSDISSSDEDDDVDEAQIQIEFEKEATSEFLFSKASTNASITSLGTKVQPPSTMAHDTDDDEVSKSDLPSPSKKQKKALNDDDDTRLDTDVVRNMYRYFELNNIDINTLEVSSVTTATAAAVADLHHQNLDMDITDSVTDSATTPTNLEQDREPSLDQTETPGPTEGPGASL